MECPDFLPSILVLNGTWDKILNCLYTVFEKDFKLKQTKHEGRIVKYDNRVLPDGHGKEEGFWHVVSKDSKTGNRLVDYRRAERLPWASPLMENQQRPEIMVFDYQEGPKDKGLRRYIWLEQYNYAVVLQHRKNTYFWITAFYIDSEWKREDLRKRYEQRTT